MTETTETEMTESEATELSGVRLWVARHPMIVAWVVLAVAMVAMLLYAARDVDLLITQRLALMLATVGLAGACVWILTWE